MMQKTCEMTETLANATPRYSFESTQQELSNKYQHDRVLRVFRKFCVLVLWTKVKASAVYVLEKSLHGLPILELNIAGKLSNWLL